MPAHPGSIPEPVAEVPAEKDAKSAPQPDDPPEHPHQPAFRFVAAGPDGLVSALAQGRPGDAPAHAGQKKNDETPPRPVGGGGE